MRRSGPRSAGEGTRAISNKLTYISSAGKKRLPSDRQRPTVNLFSDRQPPEAYLSSTSSSSVGLTGFVI